MNDEKIALFDMDGTLADFEGQLNRDLEALRNPDEPPTTVSWNDDEQPAWLRQRVRLIKAQPGWWRNLPRHTLGFDVYALARKVGFGVRVLTKGPRTTPHAWTEKLLWCQDHLDEHANVTITFDKSTVYGRVLVNDYPPYLDAWLAARPRGVAVMPAAPYNADYRHERVLRYDGKNPAEVWNLLFGAYHR